MEPYFEAKARLLELAERQVIWVEDPYGVRLAKRHPEALVVGWSHDVSATNIDADQRGTRFRLRLPDGEADAGIHLAGRFNLANALIAAACAHLLGVGVDAIAAGIADLRSVPGRFEIVSGNADVTVVVDYAHTPEGIARVIETARTFARGRVIAVIGAGGDRDKGKRPQMGRAAAAADLVVVTSDNPRSEDPRRIVEEVLTGLPTGTSDGPVTMAVLDRRAAIETALASAAVGDVVLILGKGHETGQEIAGVIHPFSDQEIARAQLARLEKARHS
jgi:UDP-N-acetylmuramoyl-L-alanyl-D-glutamate--2,6-diaminopimelate ligase